ncbi:hypothetical protein BGZ58_010590 [Dissophora ornata]|nr:hypothetical protein BGZ58_010590 [Dissophora ornata]
MAELERHKSFIKHLELSAFSSEFLALRGLDQVATFEFYVVDETLDMDMTLVTDFIAAHSSTLQEIAIYLWRCCTVKPPKDLWNAITQCSQLSSVKISNMTIPAESYSLLLQVCTKPSSLHIGDVNLSACSEIQQQNSDNISSNSHVDPALEGGPQKISVTGRFIDEDDDLALQGRNQGMMIRHFHRVKSLELRGRKCEYDTALIEALSRNPWALPSLESLVFWRSDTTDSTLAGLSKLLPPLTALTLHDTHFGPLSLQALLMGQGLQPGGHSSQLCESLTTLRITKSYSVRSAMVQRLLESCPKLTSFTANAVTVTDIARGQEWVCRDLKELNVHIKADGQVDDEDPESKKQFSEMQRLVFMKLGKLTKLERLYINYYYPFTSMQMTTLDLRLEAGLDLLSGLINLKVFSFDSDFKQQMGVQEIIWITLHWRKLGHLAGRLNGSSSVVEEMQSILKASGVVSIIP